MSSSPPEWAKEIANKLTPVQCGFVGGSDLGWYGTRDAIAEALAAAEARGMERAACVRPEVAAATEALTQSQRAFVEGLALHQRLADKEIGTARRERDEARAEVARLATNATARERMLTARTDALRACERERDALRATVENESGGVR